MIGPGQLADDRTLEALDFAAIRDRVVAATRTQRGRSRASALLPSSDFAEVGREQAATHAVREAVTGADFYVMPAMDTAELTQAAALGRVLGTLELRAVGDAVASAASAHAAARLAQSDALAPILAPYAALNSLQRTVTDAIDERGNVLDRASPALGRIRRGLAQAQHDARDRVGAIVRSAKYAKAIQDPVVTVREGRFVVPIKVEFSGEFPGIVHDTSSSGQTLFVEPLAALETNNRLRTLRIEEEREVQRVLAELSQLVGEHAAQIEVNVDVLASLDLLCAKSQVARAMDAVAPELREEPGLSIVAGRHPLLADRAVPQTIELDESARLMVISGPNMGGKTVTLKTAGLFVAMAYAGMQIPAAMGSRIGRFEHVVADIGDEQSIALNASTFSAHLVRMGEILSLASDRLLYLVDEIGGGTEPNSGAALAIAALERLMSAGAFGIVTTHATELKLFAHAAAGVKNASVRFDPDTFRPTFQLDVGTPGQSLAFPLARALGVSDAIVERAERLLDSRELEYERALTELAVRASEMQRERDGLAGERAGAQRDREALLARSAALDAEKRAFGELAEERMQAALRGFVAELERRAAERERARPKVTAAESASLSRAVDALRDDLGISAAAPAAEDAGAGFVPGDPVRITSLAQNGTIVEDYGETVLVAIGQMKTVVDKRDLRKRKGETSARTPGRGGGSAKLEAATRATAELDVRGKRYVEAEPLVDAWIDEAVLGGTGTLRLIHGKGTGMLGRGLQEFLRDHASVKSVRYGNENEGAGGVTIVELHD
jgi:DNA mismatch repair protein MutS2